MADGDVKSIDIRILTKIEKDPQLSNNPDLQFNVAEYFKSDKDSFPPSGCSVTNDGKDFACTLYDAADVIDIDDGDGNLTFDEFVKEEMSQHLLCRLSKKLCQGKATIGLLQHRFNQIAEEAKRIDEVYKTKYNKDNP